MATLHVVTGLSLGALRDANKARLPTFRDAHGRPAHSEPDGSDWSVADWFLATAGELGELGNVLKKVRRGDLSMEEARQAIAEELADTVTYLDLLAFRLGVDLSAATVEKFNAVSRRVGSRVRLDYADWHMAAETPEEAAPVRSGAPPEEDPPGTRLLAALETSIAAEEAAAPRAADGIPRQLGVALLE